MKVTSWTGGVMLGCTLLIAACTTWVAQLGARRDEIRFSHARHTRAGVECISCHEAIFESTSLGQAALPKEAKCLECHKEERASGNCALCHSSPQAPGTYARRVPTLKMNHAVHLEESEDCAVCHAAVAQAGLGEHPATSMDTCLECHEHKAQFSEARCDACHVDLRRYPLAPLTAFSHEGSFLRTHARAARSTGAACAQCHEQSFCADCHASTVGTRPEVRLAERVDRQFIHPGDFLGRHSVEARADPSSCLKCHGTSYCDSCHQQQGLGSQSEQPLQPHTAGVNTPGAPDFHGVEARRDITRCASCHDQGAESNCVRCHRVGGIGGDPHPPGWAFRHGRDEINRNAMCLACHP